MFRPGSVSVLLKMLLFPWWTSAERCRHCGFSAWHRGEWGGRCLMCRCCSDLHTGGELTGKSLRSGLQHISSFVTFIFFFFKHFLKYFPWLGDGRWGWKQERGREKPGRKGSGEDFVFITRNQLWPRWSAPIFTSSSPKYLMFLFLFQWHLVLAGF